MFEPRLTPDTLKARPTIRLRLPVVPLDEAAMRRLTAAIVGELADRRSVATIPEWGHAVTAATGTTPPCPLGMPPYTP